MLNFITTDNSTIYSRLREYGESHFWHTLYGLTSVPEAYLHSPVEFRTATQSEAVIGRALVKIGQ